MYSHTLWKYLLSLTSCVDGLAAAVLAARSGGKDSIDILKYSLYL